MGKLAHVALGVLVLGASTALAAQMPSGGWLEPQLVPGVKAGRLIQWPSVVVVADTLIIAANAAPRADRPDGSSLVLVRLPGGVLSPPTGPFYYFFPKLLVDGRRRLHMLWGEPSDTVIAAGGVPPITKLWYSSFAAGRWSTPERFFDAEDRRIAWEDQMAIAGIDELGELHVAAPVTLGGRFPLTYMKRGANGQWSVREIAPNALYGSIAAWGRGSLAAAWMAPDTVRSQSPRPDLLLMTMISNDGGKTWSTPARVPVPGAPLMRSPVLVPADGEMHLAWVMRERGRAGNGFIRHASMSLTDLLRGSTAWRVAPESEMRPGFHTRFTLAVSRCGTPMAAIEKFIRKSATESSPMIDEVEWPQAPGANDSARVVRPLFEQTDGAIGAGLVARGDGFDAVFTRMAPALDSIRLVSTHRAVCPQPRR